MPTVDFYYDISSPYSYLAATQIDRVAAKHGATVDWKPFLLGAVFKASGNTAPAANPSKAKYMLGDLMRWAEMYKVGFSFPSIFPANSVKGMRACVAAKEAGKGAAYALALFNAYWVNDKDPASPDTLASVATEVGLDGKEILAAIETQPIKDGLRVFTDKAIELGAFGAPTMVVGDVLLWGNDRLDMLEHVLGQKG